MDAKTFIQFRLTHNLTQEELASFLGVSKSAVCHIETRRMDISKRIRNLMWQLIDEYGIDREILVKPGEIQYRAKVPRKQKEREVEVKQNPIGEEIKGYNKQGTIDELGSLPPVIAGVGPDAPLVINDKGGSQSATPYRMDLIDPIAILEISKVLSEGAVKHGENNWKKININDHLNHLLVHVYAYLAGDTSDEHLSHACCRAIFALSVSKEQGK